MSSALVQVGSNQSHQLCFPWAQLENADIDNRHANKPPLRRVRQVNRSLPTRQPSQGHTTTKRPFSAVGLTPTVQSIAAQVKPLSKNTRVGEVRIGTVMLALLKQYGITDEEIEAGLATFTNG